MGLSFDCAGPRLVNSFPAIASQSVTLDPFLYIFLHSAWHGSLHDIEPHVPIQL